MSDDLVPCDICKGEKVIISRWTQETGGQSIRCPGCMGRGEVPLSVIRAKRKKRQEESRAMRSPSTEPAEPQNPSENPQPTPLTDRDYYRSEHPAACTCVECERRLLGRPGASGGSGSTTPDTSVISREGGSGKGCSSYFWWGIGALVVILLVAWVVDGVAGRDDARPTPAPAPTPNTQATVQAAIEATVQALLPSTATTLPAAAATPSPTPDTQAMVQAAIEATVQSITAKDATSSPSPTPNTVSAALPTATPASTPLPTATPTSTSLPTNTPPPTPTSTSLPTNTPPPTVTPTNTPLPTATPIPDAVATYDELRLFALSLINDDRRAHGLPPVVLGSNPAAQLHAEDMIAHDYFGHWWMDGRKPYMVYSETGGTSYVSENASTSGWTNRRWAERNCGSFLVNCIVPGVREAVEDAQWGMMYDDAHADWGHRDTILGVSHRAVNLGIASNGKRVVYVQHFEGGDVVADTRPSLSGDGVLSFSVFKIAGGVDIAEQVTIYYDPPPTPKTPEQIDLLDSYCTGGGFSTQCGEPAAAVLKPLGGGSYYVGLERTDVVANEWSETSDKFSFSASMGGLLNAPGVYTVVVWRDSADGWLSENLVELSFVKQ